MTLPPAPPAPPVRRAQHPNARTWATISIASAVIGVLFLPFVFGPIAFVCGLVGLGQYSRAAWIGVLLGGAEVIYAAVIFVQLSDALSKI